MFLVGLTGGIATGKSTVSRMLATDREHGGFSVPVIDADLIARDVVRPGCRAWRKIREIFGDEVLLETGELDRAKLGSIIFADESKRRLLNFITHPAIHRAMFIECFKCLIRGHRFVVFDIPLLYETNMMLKWFSRVIVVRCTAEQQLSRLLSRNPELSEEDARRRIASQMSLADKCELADFVIDNSSDEMTTRQQLSLIVDELNASRTHWWLRGGLLVAASALVALVSLVYKRIA